MRALPPRPRFAFALSVCLVSSGLAVHANAQSACGCGDVPQLQARFCAARASMKELDRLLDQTRRAEMKTGASEALDSSNQGEIQACVDELEAASMGSRQARRNETCIAKKPGQAAESGWDKVAGFMSEVQGVFASLGASKSVATFILEERQGHGQEAVDIENQLQEMTSRCPASMFTIERSPTVKFFSLTPCPKPTLPARQCQRQ